MIKSLSKILVSHRFKIWLIVISTAIITGIFFLSIESNYKTKDVVPEFSALTRTEQKKLGPFFAKVKVGLYIKDFSRFDVINNDFVMDAVVWFEFNPAEVSLSQIEKFSFLDGEIKYKSKPDIKITDSRVFAKYEVIVGFNSDLRFHYYPYGYHRLPIIVTNNYIPTSGMVFITSDASFTVDKRMALSNWVIDDYTTDYGFRVTKFEQVDEKKHLAYPLAIFVVDFSNIGVKNALIIFIPILFSILLGLFSLLVPLVYGIYNWVGITFATAAITSILGYRFVIQNMMPKVGYTTITDAVYTLTLAIVFVPFVLQVIISFMVSVKHKKIPEEVAFGLARWLNVLMSMAFIILTLITIIFLYKIMIL
ncbi:hypothetical protein KAW80_02225 [Candidatus Babeliales bacterium]|nr:hypothetical protein [Candidatus Babeliales bacterium]